MNARYKYILFIFIGAFCLIADAFYNGYPIVYSDTATYLASGFELQTPVDRPITYGLFILLTSLNGFTLWLVIFFQSLILSCLLFLFLKQFVGEKFTSRYGWAFILLLSLFTGISWTSSQLIADIYTPIAVLSLILLLFGKLKKRTRLFLYLTYLISICMHLSHILLFSVLLLFIFIFKKWLFNKNNFQQFYKQIAVLFILTLASIFTMGSAISKSKDVFIMGAMVEQGITKQYLDEYCANNNYKICAYKDSLPKTFNAFVWDTNSVFYKTGGWSQENRKEYNSIIMATFTKPKYILLHIKASLKATLQQLVDFHIADGNGRFLKGSIIYSRIKKYAGRDEGAYLSSKQSRGEILYEILPNRIYDAIILLSTILLFFIIIYYRKIIGRNFLAIIIVSLMAILINAWDAGTFSCVANRFGCKMIWFLPFLATIAIYKVIQKKVWNFY